MCDWYLFFRTPGSGTPTTAPSGTAAPASTPTSAAPAPAAAAAPAASAAPAAPTAAKPAPKPAAPGILTYYHTSICVVSRCQNDQNRASDKFIDRQFN